MPPTTASVAAAARAELARVGMSGRQLASAMGWTVAYTHRRLNGTQPFSVEELVALAAHLGIKVTVFLANDQSAAVAS